MHPTEENPSGRPPHKFINYKLTGSVIPFEIPREYLTPPDVFATPRRRRGKSFQSRSPPLLCFSGSEETRIFGRSEHADKQYHRPDLTERYKTGVMRAAMREGTVDQRSGRLQGRGSERERRTTAIIPRQPPYVLPRPPHLSSKPTPVRPFGRPSLTFPDPFSQPPSVSVRAPGPPCSLFLPAFVSRYLRDPAQGPL